MVYVDPEGIRRIIGDLEGLSLAAASIRNLFAGAPGRDGLRPPVRLQPSDLGNVESFYQQWDLLCDWRVAEGMDLSRVLHVTAEKVAEALAAYTKTDEEAAADIRAVDYDCILRPDYFDQDVSDRRVRAPYSPITNR